MSHMCTYMGSWRHTYVKYGGPGGTRVFIRGGTHMGVPVAHVCKVEGSWCHVCVHMWGLHGTRVCDLEVLVAHACTYVVEHTCTCVEGARWHTYVEYQSPGATYVYICGVQVAHVCKIWGSQWHIRVHTWWNTRVHAWRGASSTRM